jgi:hypothetical protein
MKDNIVKLNNKGVNIQNKREYRAEQKLYDELKAVLVKFGGSVSFVGVLGVFDLLKEVVIRNQDV